MDFSCAFSASPHRSPDQLSIWKISRRSPSDTWLLVPFHKVLRGPSFAFPSPALTTSSFHSQHTTPDWAEDRDQCSPTLFLDVCLPEAFSSDFNLPPDHLILALRSSRLTKRSLIGGRPPATGLVNAPVPVPLSKIQAPVTYERDPQILQVFHQGLDLSPQLKIFKYPRWLNIIPVEYLTPGNYRTIVFVTLLKR